MPCPGPIENSPLAPILIRLADEGFRFRMSQTGQAQVSPASRLTPDVRALFAQHDGDLRVLVALATDVGVRDRRDLFRAQWDAAGENTVPAFLFVSGLLPMKGACFSCGELLSATNDVGRCWRCALAWRIAAGAPFIASEIIVCDVQ